MREIERKMLKAIEDKRDWSLSNTRVEYQHEPAHKGNFVGTHARVYLHGHHIANFWQHGGVEVNTDTLRRWPTVTTKSRLRALGAKLTQKNWQLYLNGEAI